eukprot:s358_g11.t1
MASIKRLPKVLGCIIISVTHCRAADGRHKVLAVDQLANFEEASEAGASDASDASSAALIRSESNSPNLVKNGDFEKGMADWKEYKPSRPNIAHKMEVGGKTTMHLHGWCYETGGGVQQEITTSPGRSYTLKWSAYSGHWDGKQEVEFTVNFGDFTKTFKIDKSKKGPAITAQHQLNDPELALELFRKIAKFEETVTTSTGKTVLSFYAPTANCMNIDDVVLTLDPTTTTTTPKSGARGATVAVAAFTTVLATLASQRNHF